MNTAFSQTGNSDIEKAFRFLKDSPAKVDSLNKFCRKMENNEQSIALEIRVLALGEKIN